MIASTFGKNLAKMARDVDQPSKQFQFVFILKFNYLKNYNSNYLYILVNK